VLFLLFLTGQRLSPMTGRTVAAGGGSGVALVAVANWGELRVVDGFFLCVFLAPCFCSPVALASSSISNGGCCCWRSNGGSFL
jgi:hypothetical protein